MGLLETVLNAAALQVYEMENLVKLEGGPYSGVDLIKTLLRNITTILISIFLTTKTQIKMSLAP